MFVVRDVLIGAGILARFPINTDLTPACQPIARLLMMLRLSGQP
jgi:hypothetical protein